MQKSIKWMFLSCLVLMVSMLNTPSFAESIEDGYIARKETSVILKDGSAVKCNSILWLTKSADFIQCDKDGACTEIKIDQVDMEKTFGPEIAKEYSDSRPELKNEYAKEKEKMKERVVSYENSPLIDEEKESPAETASPNPSVTDSGVTETRPSKTGPIKVKHTPEKRQQLEAELKRCLDYLKRTKSAGPPDTLPGHVQMELMRNGIHDMSPEEYWKRQVKEIEEKCNRCKKRVEGYIIQEPRSVSIN